MNELDDLLDRVETPYVSVGDDVTRGQRALRRRRGWQALTAGLAIAGVAGAVAALPIHHEPEFRVAQYASQPPALKGKVTYVGTAINPHRATKQEFRKWGFRQMAMETDGGYTTDQLDAALKGYRDVLADDLDPQGTRLSPVTNRQVDGLWDDARKTLRLAYLGTKLDWNDGGLIQVWVTPSYEDIINYVEGSDWGKYGMKDTTYDGMPAQVSTKGSDLAVSVQHADGTKVTLVASQTFGNNGTSASQLGLTQDQLLAAAADDRIVALEHAHPFRLRDLKYLMPDAWARYAG